MGNWYKEALRVVTQKDYHKRMIRRYRERLVKAKRKQRRLKKKEDDRGVKRMEKRIERYERILSHHKDRLYYYNKQEN